MAKPLSISAKQKKVKVVLDRLYKLIPEPKTELNFTTPFQLLVAVMLSAQTTDVTVNKVTPVLFEHFPDAESFAQATTEKIDADIKSVNYHFTKAKHIYEAAKMILEKHAGKLPKTLAELTELPGVGRKTANVVLGTGFGIPSGVVVDTHVRRLSQKLGFTTNEDPVKIEQDLMEIVPKDTWIDFSHLLILTGRRYCPARNLKCELCPLCDLFVAE